MQWVRLKVNNLTVYIDTGRSVKDGRFLFMLVKKTGCGTINSNRFLWTGANHEKYFWQNQRTAEDISALAGVWRSLFAVVNAIMYFIDLRAAVVFSAALLIYLVFLTVFMITKHNFFTRNIIEFASGYAQMQKRMMDDLMVPYGLLDESGHIIWLNNAFTEIVSKEDYHKGLASIFPEVGELDFAAGLDKMNEVSLKFGGRDYRLVIESVDMSGIDMDAGMVDADENTRIYAMYLLMRLKSMSAVRNCMMRDAL